MASTPHTIAGVTTGFPHDDGDHDCDHPPHPAEDHLLTNAELTSPPPKTIDLIGVDLVGHFARAELLASGWVFDAESTVERPPPRATHRTRAPPAIA